jgi:uncharacterized protein YaaN involved in tellurite resistance
MAFSMQLPDMEAVKQEVENETKPKTEEQEALERQAQENALAILNADLDAANDRRAILADMDAFGLDTVRASAKKNQLLQIPVGKLSKSGDEGSLVSQSLMDLSRVIKDLDPSAVDFAKSGALGKLFNPLRNFFQRYEKADQVIAGILTALDKGQQTLRNDNVTLEIERQDMRELTLKLQKQVELGAMMDACIEKAVEEAREKNESLDKIRFVNEEILFPLRQRVMDMQQMIAVNQQGVLAIEVIRRNNQELIRGVERAKTVTVSALRIAVMVAGALYNQKIVLKKIQALNETTNTLIAGTSKMLREQGTEIQRQAVDTGVNPETLRQAYADVVAALDEIGKFKTEALPRMKTTVEQFRSLAEDGEKQIARIEKGRLALGEGS